MTQTGIFPFEDDVKIRSDLSPASSPDTVQAAGPHVAVRKLVVLVKKLVVVGLVSVARFGVDKNFLLEVERVNVAGRGDGFADVQLAFRDLVANVRGQRLHHEIVSDSAVLMSKIGENLPNSIIKSCQSRL